jgi:hypothetical protein
VSYLVFCGAVYYAEGGWKDFRGSFGTLEEAKQAARPTEDDGYFEDGFEAYWWAHVVRDGEIVTELIGGVWS